MRFLWTLAKVVLGLAIAIPLLLIGLAAAFGILGAIAALALLVLRAAVVCLVVWGVFRLAMALFGSGSRDSRPDKHLEVKPLPPVDPHYEAAMRELDRELGERTR